MTFKKLFAFPVLAILALWSSLSQATSLEDVLALTYQTNPQIAAEQAQLRAIDEGVPQAEAGWRPTVTATGGQGILHQSSTLMCGPPNCYVGHIDSVSHLSPQSTTLTVSQPIYTGGTTVAQTRRALALVHAEQANLIGTENTVLFAATADYLGVILAEQQFQLNQGYVRSLERHVDMTEGRRKSGEFTETDVLLAKTYRSQAIAGLRGAEGTLESARAVYERDVGDIPGRLRFPSKPASLPASFDEASDAVTNSNPAVVQARFAYDAAEQNVRSVEGQLLPSVSLQAAVERDRNTAEQGLMTVQKQIQVQVTIPLYDGGVTYAQARAAKDRAAQQRGTIDDTIRATVQAVRQAWSAMSTATATIAEVRKQIGLAESTLKKTEEENLLGTRSVFDILNLEQILFQARLSLVQAEHDERLNQFAILQQLGLLTPVGLSLPVEEFDAVGHLDRARGKWFGLGPDGGG